MTTAAMLGDCNPCGNFIVVRLRAAASHRLAIRSRHHLLDLSPQSVRVGIPQLPGRPAPGSYQPAQGDHGQFWHVTAQSDLVLPIADQVLGDPARGQATCDLFRTGTDELTDRADANALEPLGGFGTDDG